MDAKKRKALEYAVKRLLATERIGWKRLAEEFGLTERQARDVLLQAKAIVEYHSPDGVELSVDVQAEIEKLKAELRDYKKRLRSAYLKLQEARDLTSLLDTIVKPLELPKDWTKYKPWPERPKDDAMVLLFGDWHAGERVDEKQVLGLNRYDTPILYGRIEQVVNKVLKFQDIESGDYSVYRKLYVLCLGDMVSGVIHDDLLENQDFGYLQQSVVAGWLLAQAIHALSPYFEEIDVVCVSGNHGRLTRQWRYKGQQIHSYDHMAYQLAAMWTANDGANWHISQSPQATVDILGWQFVVVHGDGIRSWMRLPFYGMDRKLKDIRELRELTGQLTHYLVMGHFHTDALIRVGNGHIIVNGSPKGIDEYSVSGERTTVPSQIVLGVNRKYGVTWYRPAYCTTNDGPDAFVLPDLDLWQKNLYHLD